MKIAQANENRLQQWSNYHRKKKGEIHKEHCMKERAYTRMIVAGTERCTKSFPKEFFLKKTNLSWSVSTMS